MEEIPTIDLSHLTDEQRRQYALVHNQLTMNTGWNQDLLAIELDQLIGSWEPETYGIELEPVEVDLGKPELEPSSSEEIWGVIVEVENEDQQDSLLAQLLEEGYKCRTLM